MITTQDILHLLTASRLSSKQIAKVPNDVRNFVLTGIADKLSSRQNQILSANQLDLDRMSDDDPKKDRLLLNLDRLEGLKSSLHEIMNSPQPDGHVVYEKKLENGLVINKSLVPIGVVAAIFESRPNVTIDIAALCIKSGNAAILRGGTDALHTNKVLIEIIQEALEENGLSKEIITLYPPDRLLLQDLLTADRYVDLVIPRGSSSLINFVRENSTIPTIETGAGVCHTYVSKYADFDKAVEICVNARVSRPSVCNSLDCIIVHKQAAQQFLEKVKIPLISYEVEVFGDDDSYRILEKMKYPYLKIAAESDFGREFLDLKCAIKVVEDLESALHHIEKYSSRHSECIVSENETECETFIESVDAAAVYSNASTRFTDGGVFGLGAEIGISTQKLHARGPFGMEKLLTEKWIGRGSGQIRG